MTTEIAGLSRLVIGDSGTRLINMKLTRGDAEVITPEQMWAEIGKIFVQRACGLKPSAGPVKSGKPQVDVRSLVDGLR